MCFIVRPEVRGGNKFAGSTIKVRFDLNDLRHKQVWKDGTRHENAVPLTLRDLHQPRERWPDEVDAAQAPKAHLLSGDILQNIRLLTNFSGLFSLSVCVDPVWATETTSDISASGYFHPITQRMNVRFHMESMSLQETRVHQTPTRKHSSGFYKRSYGCYIRPWWL